MRARLGPAAAALVAALAACQPAPPPPRVAEPSVGFDPERAWSHLEALTRIGPRVMGSEGAARARAYIRAELTKLGLEVREQPVKVIRRPTPGWAPGHAEPAAGGLPPIQLHNIGATIPGASEDLILLIAPYDSQAFASFRFVGANDGASGAAVLLELARVLAARPLGYTTWVIFLEGEAPFGPPGEPPAPTYFGSRGLTQLVRNRDAFDDVRLAVFVNRVCDPDLRIARDLRSERVYREEFWMAAHRLGHDDAFPERAEYETPNASHEALADGGLRRVVALVDASFGGGEPPGALAGTEDDDLEHCSAQSLGIVGEVMLEGLSSISTRLAKIDRFAASPRGDHDRMRLEDLELDEPRADTPGAEAPAAGAAGEGAARASEPSGSTP
jgi:hypothetical protein